MAQDERVQAVPKQTHEDVNREIANLKEQINKLQSTSEPYAAIMPHAALNHIQKIRVRYDDGAASPAPQVDRPHSETNASDGDKPMDDSSLRGR